MFFFNDTATTEIYTLSLHDALPISNQPMKLICTLAAIALGATLGRTAMAQSTADVSRTLTLAGERLESFFARRSEEHTSELQSRQYLVCRLLLEKKKNNRLSLPLC